MFIFEVLQHFVDLVGGLHAFVLPVLDEPLKQNWETIQER